MSQDFLSVDSIISRSGDLVTNYLVAHQNLWRQSYDGSLACRKLDCLSLLIASRRTRGLVLWRSVRHFVVRSGLHQVGSSPITGNENDYSSTTHYVSLVLLIVQASFLLRIIH